MPLFATTADTAVLSVPEDSPLELPLLLSNGAEIGDVEHTNGTKPSNEAVNVEDEETSDSESDDGNDDGQKPRQFSERKRMQYAVFNDWKSRRAEKTTKEEVQARVQSVDDELLSIRSLMTRQESNVIISDPREYQTELFERAKNENIIAVLDTGSGKTLIAVLLLRHIIDQELERRASGNPPRIAFFIVDIATLVYQQFAVLECNLNQKAERFCGDMNVDSWNKSSWDEHFKNNMAIVCTADILCNCLQHSFVTMEQINLLIFDEAHHTKKNHAYARIIKEFYIPCIPARRPKIFGMTASPVDAKVDVVQAARELESLLHCKIATSADLALVKASVSRPEEKVVTYAPLPASYTTSLCAELENRLKGTNCLKKYFRQAKEIASELGEWCADRLWSLALADEEFEKLQCKAEQGFVAEVVGRDVLNEELRQLQEAKSIVMDPSHSLPPPSFEDNSLSSKVLSLKEFLDGQFENPTEARCIVFVKKRFTARLLAELFQHIGSKHMRLALLIGTRQAEAGDLKVTIRQQMLTLMKFRKGELNLLFATSIAEEGLDIPDCNVIVRFDLYVTLIQYIQSRGRARHKQSRYIHMLEIGNPYHMQMLRDVQQGEKLMRDFCIKQPVDRLLQGNDSDLDKCLSKERAYQTYTEPSTGARLSFGSVLTQISYFVSSLTRDQENLQQAFYVMSFQQRKFVCEILLPASSPIRSVMGRPYSRKSLAKRSAAFEACLLLRQRGYLDEHLLPIYHKKLPAMRNAQLALNVKKTNAYEMQLKPSLWEKSRGSTPTELYMTIIDMDDPLAAVRPYTPLALLTRKPLPCFPSFPIFPHPGVTCNVKCTQVDGALPLSAGVAALLTEFTLRLYKDLFNKTFEPDESNTSYWLAPAVRIVNDDSRSSLPYNFIDWEILEQVKACDYVAWDPSIPPEELIDRFVVDPYHGGTRFYTLRIDPELRPTDPVPEGCAAHKYKDSILAYTSNMWKNSRNRFTYRMDQPVVEAYQIPFRRNWLDDWDENDKKANTRAFICLEPLKISVLPTTVVAMGYFFPAIITRLDSYLIVLEACDMLNLKVQPNLALEAMTKDSDNTEEHRTEQIHFQRGMGKNYERLEFIGDAFLKMATSISLYAQNAHDDEFESHVKRMLMICNKNLFNTAVGLELYKYVRSQGFSRRTWYPEGLKLLAGKDAKKSSPQVQKHHLNDKTIADVCEALIGASLLSYEESGDMDMAVRAVTTFVKNKDHNVQQWDDYNKLYTKPAYQIAESSAAQVDLANQIEKLIGYRFNYPRLLRCAFTHPSYPFCYEKIPSYQRLEFLGDSLLDMACINFLFNRHPDRDPQWLTEHKMAMVSNKFLGALCVRLKFYKHLRSHHNSLMFLISEYVFEIEEAEAQSNGARDYWTVTKNPPKCLPDIVEAYLGALFVDSSFSFSVITAFFEQHIRWYFEDMSIYDTFANNHPTTYLSNLLTLSFNCTHFRVLADEIPPSVDGGPPRVVAVVMVHFQIIADSEGSSGKYAKIRASAEAVELLKGLAPWEFREKYKCDCKEQEEDDVVAKETRELENGDPWGKINGTSVARMGDLAGTAI